MKELGGRLKPRLRAQGPKGVGVHLCLLARPYSYWVEVSPEAIFTAPKEERTRSFLQRVLRP